MKAWATLSTLAFAVLALAGGLRAGPPYQTDDPEPPETGHWEMFLAAAASADPTGESGFLPQYECNYGALENLQLSVSVQASFARGQGFANYGVGDALLGAKLRFLQETDQLPQAAFYPQLSVPTGNLDKDLGSGKAQLFLPLWYQKSWGPWTNFGGGGYWINPGPGNRNWTFVGDALQRDLGDRFSLGAELFYHSAAEDGEVDGLGANAALLLHLDKDDHLIGSAGRDIFWGSTTFTGYVAYQKLI